MKILLQKLFLASVFIFIVFQGFSQGLIIIESDEMGTGSLIVDSAIVDHTAEVNRYIPSGNWHIISSPVGDQQLGLFAAAPVNSIVLNTTAGNYDLAPYDELENGWTPYTEAANTDIFEIAKAYSTRRSTVGAVRFSGIVNVGDFNIPVTRSVDGYGWNGIGNPYTSHIVTSGDAGFITINSDVFEDSYRALYVWDQSVNDYSVILETDSTIIIETKDTLGFDGIAVGQGFIIKAKYDTIVTFNRGMQAHVNEFDVPFKSAEIPWSLVKLNVNTGSGRNSTHFAFNPGMTKGLNPGFDVGKLKGNPNLALYSKLLEEEADVDFAIQALPTNDFEGYRIPIGLDFKGSGIINFTAQTLNLPVGMEIYLEDTQENTFTKIDSRNTKYVTNIENGTSGVGRFYLLTSSNLVSTDSELRQAQIGAFINNGRIYINGELDENAKVSVYSIDGKVWYQNSIHNMNDRSIDSSKYPAGVYLLHIHQKESRQIIKLVHAGVKY